MTEEWPNEESDVGNADGVGDKVRPYLPYGSRRFMVGMISVVLQRRSSDFSVDFRFSFSFLPIFAISVFGYRWFPQEVSGLVGVSGLRSPVFLCFVSVPSYLLVEAGNRVSEVECCARAWAGVSI